MPTWEQLVRDHHALAFRVARSVLRDDASAEDAVQDLYLRFLRDPAALERAANLKAFVARAAVNAALDQKRSAGRREKRERAATREEAVMDSVEQAARAELRAKVAELPDEQRLAVEMHYFHGLTKEETAAALDVPAGTVSSRLNAALGRLRTALAAAAFAGLLAMLESELAKCGAEEAVPAGLKGRLLGLRQAPGSAATGAARPSVRLPVAAIAGGALLALLLAVAARKAFWDAEGSGERPGASGEAADTGGSRTEAPAPPAVAETPAPPPATETEERVETILEGFLFRRDGGVFVCNVTAWDHMPKQTMWNPAAERLRAWNESLTIARGLEGLPAADAANFGAFLLKGAPASSAPQSRVRLKVRAPRLPDASEPEDPMRMETPRFAPQPAELVEVLDSEVLGEAWLGAWREMHAAMADLWAAWRMEPGAEKRSAMLAAATRLGTAWELARAARRGDRKAAWRVQRESEAVSGALDKLAPVGLDGLLPPWPTPDELHAVLMDSASPAALRSAVTGRWGEEALALDAWCYRSTGPGAWSWSSVSLSAAAAMSDAAFATLHEELEGIPNNRREAPAGSAMEERRRGERARVAAFGLELADLAALDRERFLIECGAIVRAVTPDSPAGRLGLQAGDILWKTVSTWEGKGGRTTGDVPIWGEFGLATSLQDGGDPAECLLGLKVLRGGETLELRFAR